VNELISKISQIGHSVFQSGFLSYFTAKFFVVIFNNYSSTPIHGSASGKKFMPFSGLRQPEALKANYSGYWSRRINLEHRIVYKVEKDQIVVFSLFGHYQS
jgi:Txe/YoeB family toxin of Txe-Axe toxin-antitoxin module